MKTDIETTGGTSDTIFTDMLLKNVQAGDVKGIVVGVPLYNIEDATMKVNYYFWIFNSGSADKTLTVKACDNTTACGTEADFSTDLAATVSITSKSRKLVKVVMMKSANAGEIKLGVDAGVIFDSKFVRRLQMLNQEEEQIKLR